MVCQGKNIHMQILVNEVQCPSDRQEQNGGNEQEYQTWKRSTQLMLKVKHGRGMMWYLAVI